MTSLERSTQLHPDSTANFEVNGAASCSTNLSSQDSLASWSDEYYESPTKRRPRKRLRNAKNKRRKLVKLISNNPGLTAILLSEHLGWSASTVRKWADTLVADKQVKCVRIGRSTHYFISTFSFDSQ